MEKEGQISHGRLVLLHRVIQQIVATFEIEYTENFFFMIEILVKSQKIEISLWFFTFLRALEIQINSTLLYAQKWAESTRSNRKDFPRTVQYTQAFHLSQNYNTQICKQILKLFNPMSIDMQMITLTHEKLHFLYRSMQRVHYGLINIQTFVSHFVAKKFL